MMTGRRLPEVLRSRRLSHRASLELVLYLLVPWLFVLPWSVLYHLLLVELWFSASTVFGAHGLGETVLYAAAWYLLGFWPALVTAGMARRRDRAMTPFAALQMGHAFVITNYLSYVCAWRALVRMIRGQNGWAKTARISEGPSANLADESRPARAAA